MTILTHASLDFARAHIERYYDSDFFPKPADYEAIWAKWDEVKTYLSSRNVGKLPLAPPRTLPAPKGTRGYRIVHQLEPLSALIYTALAYEVAPAIEAARFPPDVACAYRISCDGSSFFATGTGYDTFAARCDTLSQEYTYVLMADLADFYNRLYLHRLNNAIELADRTLKPQADEIELFLSRLNNKASQGVPVGPAASIVMAEALCSDIDQFAWNEGFVHVRYVDDFRFFSNDPVLLQIFLERLAAYLYESHRLQLAWAKTAILSVEEYRTTYLKTPEKAEKEELLDVLDAVSAYPQNYSGAEVDDLAAKYLTADEPSPPSPPPGDSWDLDTLLASFERAEWERKKEVRAQVFARLLEKAVSSDDVDIGLARRVLRTCRTLKVADIVDTVFAHLPKLAPVIPDVCLYLDAITTHPYSESIRPALGEALLHAPGHMSQFVRHWLCWYAAGHVAFASDREIGRYLITAAPVEWQARAATTTRNLAWVRSKKASLADFGVTQRRAVLLASRIMPRDERKGWLSTVKTSTEDVLESLMIEWLLSLP